MTSRASPVAHLDATAGREVVYCHACSHEWYRDDRGLGCPSCGSDVTEIVSPENDPRYVSVSGSTSPDIPPLRYAEDSDPEEADIEEHIGPQGFYFHRSTRSDSEQGHHDPSLDPVFERFYDMIANFGQGAHTRRNESSGLFGRANNDNSAPPPPPPPPPRIHRTTFTSGTLGGGTASVTIFSAPAPVARGRNNSGDGGEGGEQHNHGGGDPFQTIFSSIIREIPPPAGGPPPGFARGLQEILNLFNNPANAMRGDAVYSQEALDRIITQLMEANPQSNAAPPASEEALNKLDRRPVNQELLEPEGKTECSICIDEMKVGDTAAFLPCKHWFHEDCVVLWLKEHNTCPVCRTSIEKNENSTASRNVANGSSSNTRASRPNPNSSPNFSRSNSNQSHTFNSRYDGGADTPTGIVATDMVSSIYVDAQDGSPDDRLSQALRSVESMQCEGEHDRSGGATTSGVSYDTSRLQRRTSHSPTSPRSVNLAQQGARMRQRSPSESNRRGNGERDGRRQQPGTGAWSWFRERFSGAGSGESSQESQDQGHH